MKRKLTIEEYLENSSKFAGSDYGRMVRDQFKNSRGESELGMLVAPSLKELEQLKRAVGIMTADEKENAADLSDEQIQKIAADAGVNSGNLAIFINGYALHCKRVS